MNEYAAHSAPYRDGWKGRFRRVDRSTYEDVAENGTPKVFPTPMAAENAALRAIVAIINGDIVRWGERLSPGQCEAERVFGSVFQNGRKIEVVRRR